MDKVLKICKFKKNLKTWPMFGWEFAPSNMRPYMFQP